ncbi:response regulator [Rubrivivax albus]|uniref:Response regulator transcription factor n=1 Tax=Rubrivivax albus TaxID=2499835 RepID=A0A3S2WSP4_9BURK|nr:response regulator transcription factor [Rubrivivax albus]RVT49733.1 response regulator transcription factor [Rubrivivax albus]
MTDDPTALHLLIVDDHPLVRAGLRARLLAERWIAEVVEAGDGAEALEALQDQPPDLMLADLSMPGMNGIELLRRMRELRLDTPVIALSMFNHREYVIAAVRAGARGYVLKDGPLDEIVDAVREVIAGRQYFSRPVADLALGVPDGEPQITDREREVLLLVAHGRSNKEAARELGISVRTVEAHRLSIRRKLGVESSSEFLKLAVAQGWTHL